MIKTAVNPLFESFVSLINFCKDFDPNKAWDLLIHFPGNYEVWWTTLLKESPQHVLIETSLIIFIVWLLFIRRTVDPKKISKTEKLSKKEIDWLLDSWQPEPLAPPLNDTNKKLLSSLKVFLSFFHAKKYFFIWYFYIIHRLLKVLKVIIFTLEELINQF